MWLSGVNGDLVAEPSLMNSFALFWFRHTVSVREPVFVEVDGLLGEPFGKSISYAVLQGALQSDCVPLDVCI